MRAVVCSVLDGPEHLTFEELPPVVPGSGEVVVDVAAASMNFPDLLTIRGLYQVRPEPPFTPGFEAAGTVSAVGEGVVTLSVGDRVAVTGVVGAFAEQWLVPATSCLPLPAGVSFEAGATVSVTYGTSYHALKQRARLEPGETLLVLGAAGGVGSAAVEIAAHMGAIVIAAASTDEKLAFCRGIGATEIVNYTSEDLRERIREITDGQGVDVVYDPVGGALTETAFRSIAWNGRHLVVGFAAGDIPHLPLNLPLLKGASLVGVFWGAFASKEPVAFRENTRELLELVRSGDLTPRISHRLPLEDFREGYRLFESRSVTGKVLLIP